MLMRTKNAEVKANSRKIGANGKALSGGGGSNARPTNRSSAKEIGDEQILEA